MSFIFSIRSIIRFIFFLSLLPVSVLLLEADAQNAGQELIQVAADFPLDDTSLDRSNLDRIVSFSDVLEKVTPAVVGVYPSRFVSETEREQNPLEEMLRRYYGLPEPENEGGDTQREFRQSQGIGSGVVVSPDGYILTNHHVVTDERGNQADEILVQFSDESEYSAKIVGSDELTDVAVLKIDAADLPYLQMADSDNLRVGDIVFAVGNPLGVGLTVTMGIVSATGRADLGILGRSGYENFIQTDASINPGNSGGALVDAEGRLVGINSAILSGNGGNIGIGFAIPVTLSRNIMLSLIETGEVQRGLLGVRIEDLTRELSEAFGYESTRGALVNSVEAGLPAEKAGIERGDIIIKVSGKSIENVNDLRLTIASTPPGTPVVITVLRDQQEMDFEVVLTDLDSNISDTGGIISEELLEGVTLEVLTPPLRQEYNIDDEVEGLLVSGVEARSPHYNSIKEGAVIVEINDQAVQDISAAKEALKKGANKLWVYDRGAYRFQAIRIE